MITVSEVVEKFEAGTLTALPRKWQEEEAEAKALAAELKSGKVYDAAEGERVTTALMAYSRLLQPPARLEQDKAGEHGRRNAGDHHYWGAKELDRGR